MSISKSASRGALGEQENYNIRYTYNNRAEARAKHPERYPPGHQLPQLEGDACLGAHRVGTGTDEVVGEAGVTEATEVVHRDVPTEQPAEAGHHGVAHLLGVSGVRLGGLPRVDLGVGLGTAGRPEGDLVVLEAGHLDGQVGALVAVHGLEVGVAEAKRLEARGGVGRGLAKLTHGASPHLSPGVVEPCGVARVRFKRGLKRCLEPSSQFPFETVVIFKLL